MYFEIYFGQQSKNHLDKSFPEGTGYRARTRFAKFFNLPELMAIFKEVADIKTSCICRCRKQSLKRWL